MYSLVISFCLKVACSLEDRNLIYLVSSFTVNKLYDHLLQFYSQHFYQNYLICLFSDLGPLFSYDSISVRL